MDPKAQFFFFVAGAVCFVLAAVGEAWKYGARSRVGAKPLIALMPLGLFLWIFPTVWTTAKAAW